MELRFHLIQLDLYRVLATIDVLNIQTAGCLQALIKNNPNTPNQKTDTDPFAQGPQCQYL
eukprot:2062799-Amphidinium_carterae.1